MIRLLVFAFLIYFGYRLLKGKIASMIESAQRGYEPQDRGNSVQEAELIRDPQCGVFFMKSKGIPANVQGRTLYFCSEACRDAFLKQNGPR
jgi:YHS domain-containing protein